MEDNSIMPFGKYKGSAMVNVPASYLLWLYENDKCNNAVREYIKDNLDVIKDEIKKGKKTNQ